MKKLLLYLLLMLSVATASAQSMTGVRIFINPGHGGYDSDDRNMVVYPFTSGDHNGFWESQSNLDKGVMLKELLDSAGATTAISRTQNRTQDDLGLSTIVRMANDFNSDFMISIHSNAGMNNSVLMLYAGVDLDDTHTYPSATPCSDVSRTISTVIAQNLYSNQVTHWFSNYGVRGDKTFARTAMGWSNGYGVLRGLTVPGVISEGAMHDYVPETYRLLNMEYKWMESWHFFKSFASYFNCGDIPTGNIAGSVLDGNNKNQLPNFFCAKNSRDEMLPICGANVYLIQGTDTLQQYTTDTLYNGFYLFKKVTPGNYTISVDASNYYAYSQSIQVVANQMNYANVDLNMVRSTPPVVVSSLPAPTSITDSVEVATDIVLNFNWDMDEAATASAFHISPNVAGTISFENSRRTLRFTPNAPLDKATEYTVTLDTTACHPDTTQQNHLQTPYVLVFRTKNRSRLSLVLSYPQVNDSTIGVKPLIKLVFDQKLSTAILSTSNLPKLFVIKSQNGQIVTPGGRPTTNSAPTGYGSVFFDLSADLQPNTNYTLTLAPNLADVSGVTLVDSIVIPFRTYTEYIGNLPLVDDCETISFTYDASQSVSTTSGAVLKNTSKKRYGLACNEMKYNFSDNDGSIYYSFNNRNILVNQQSTFGMHLLGDFSMNELWLQASIDGDIHWVKVATLDFSSWRYVEIKFDSVLPANTDYTLTGFKLIRRPSLLSKSGSFFIDNLMKFQDTVSGTNDAWSSQIVVYPNPAVDYVYIDGMSTDSAEWLLVNTNGMTVKKGLGREVYVGDMAAGLYFLQIHSQEQVVTKSLMVK